MCSETSPPRISFSHDVVPADDHLVPIVHNFMSDPTSDFEFSVCTNIDHESSSADELFCNGVILPIQIPGRIIENKRTHQQRDSSSSSPSTTENSKKEIAEEFKTNTVNSNSQSKSFWGFKRSSSLNCESKRSSLFFSLPLLSRSKSTSSKKQQQFVKMGKPLKSSSSSNSKTTQKPPRRKNHNGGGLYGDNVWISPILNLPNPSVYRGSGNMFGLGSLLRSSGKDKKSRK